MTLNHALYLVGGLFGGAAALVTIGTLLHHKPEVAEALLSMLPAPPVVLERMTMGRYSVAADGHHGCLTVGCVPATWTPDELRAASRP